MTIPCYVSGRGMHATDKTRQLKVEVIQILEATGAGFDTRYRFYQHQYPEMEAHDLVRMICDPIEYYDKDWESYRATQITDHNEDEKLTAFVMKRDGEFRRQAQAAIYCFDEAGFGSGINTMRFLLAGKPLLGFYHTIAREHGMNINNVLQLALEFPDLVDLVCYQALEEIRPALLGWLERQI